MTVRPTSLPVSASCRHNRPGSPCLTTPGRALCPLLIYSTSEAGSYLMFNVSLLMTPHSKLGVQDLRRQKSRTSPILPISRPLPAQEHAANSLYKSCFHSQKQSPCQALSCLHGRAWDLRQHFRWPPGLRRV